MTPRFNNFVPFVIKHEVVFKKGHYGDYNYVLCEHDPNDPGGTTKYGIDYGEHKESPWKMTEKTIENLTLDDATQVYWRHWCFDRAELMPPQIGECFFNCATMSGRNQAQLILNRTKTAKEFLQDELNVFYKIVQRRPASSVYLSGWKARIYDLAKFLDIDLLAR